MEVKKFSEYLTEEAAKDLSRSLFMALKRRLGNKGWDVSNSGGAIAMKDSGKGVAEEAMKALSDIAKNRGEKVTEFKKGNLSGAYSMPMGGASVSVTDTGKVVKVTVS